MIWPISSSESALLRAALLEGSDAITAFKEWRSLVDIDGRHDNGQFRMLPMVYANMSLLGHEDPVMGRLCGVFRQSWVRSRQRLHDAEGALILLENRGIPTMVLKGLALSSSYYRSPTLRPMDDIDILVPHWRVKDALQTLFTSGWRNDELLDHMRNRSLRELLANRSGIELRNESGRVVDLHWTPLHEHRKPILADWFWRGAQSMSFGLANTLRPAPECLLLHVISHGIRPGGSSYLQWVSDATMILTRSADQINWSDFWHMARRARIEMRISVVLQRLESVSAAKIPAAAHHRSRPSFIELLERPALSRRGAEMFKGVPGLLLFLASVLRVTRDVDGRTFIALSKHKMRDWRHRLLD